MSFAFYGSETVLDMLQKMQQHDHTAHGFLFYGEAGLGKKTLAAHFMASMLCTGAEKPCGQCKACHMIQNHVHPDVHEAEHSGKRGGFSVETVRSICMDIATPPNEGDTKFYLFADCDTMDPRSQNLLLKAVEEPPDDTYFIFTATAPTALLSTIRSRIISMPVTPVTESQCRTVLAERGYPPEECDAAVTAFHGNIGQCLAFLEDEIIRDTVALTKNAINSIINRNEYALLQAAAALGKERQRVQLFLTLFDRTIRDALTQKYNSNTTPIGCDPVGAAQLAERLSTTGGQAIHLAIDKAYAALEANVNLLLILSALCASCMDVS